MANSLADSGNAVGQGVTDALRNVVSGVPDILVAVVVLLVGVVVASIMKTVVVKVLQSIRIKPLSERLGLNRIFESRVDAVGLIGDLVKWFFVIVFLIQALNIAHLDQVSEIVRNILDYVPNVLAAAALVFVGAVVADLTSRVVRDAAMVLGGTTATLLSSLTRYSIWVVVILTGLEQLRIETQFLNTLFIAIAAMLALAGGLAFGLGGRDVAKDILEGVRKNLKK